MAGVVVMGGRHLLPPQIFGKKSQLQKKERYQTLILTTTEYK
jgi:hypothetical protein